MPNLMPALCDTLVVALSGGVMAMEVNVDDSAVAIMYGDHQAPMQDEPWREEERYVE